MLNLVYNRVIIKGDKDKIKEVVGEFDFDKIIPTPSPALHIEDGSTLDKAIKCFNSEDKLATAKEEFPNLTSEKESKDLSYLYANNGKTVLNPFLKSPRTLGDVIALGRIACENKEKYGAYTWYDWNTKNWGTKWNAGDIFLKEEDDGFLYEFITAWSMPYPIFEKICASLPECYIKWVWIDEGDGIEQVTVFNGAE